MAALPIPDYFDPRQQAVRDRYPRAVEADDSVALGAVDEELRRATRESVERSRRIAAKEALQAICEAFPDGFAVLLQRDRLVDVFGTQALEKAFNEILDERRRT